MQCCELAPHIPEDWMDCVSGRSIPGNSTSEMAVYRVKEWYLLTIYVGYEWVALSIYLSWRKPNIYTSNREAVRLFVYVSQSSSPIGGRGGETECLYIPVSVPAEEKLESRDVWASSAFNTPLYSAHSLNLAIAAPLWFDHFFISLLRYRVPSWSEWTAPCLRAWLVHRPLVCLSLSTITL
jgi:hypothetical protein